MCVNGKRLEDHLELCLQSSSQPLLMGDLVFFTSSDISTTGSGTSDQDFLSILAISNQYNSPCVV